MAKVPRELVLQREVQAWTLRCAGASQETIAADLRVTQQAVSKLLARVFRRQSATLTASVEHYKAVSVARLETIIAEGFTAWQKSKDARKKSRIKKTTSPLLSPAELADMEDGKALPPGSGVISEIREETTKEALTSNGDPAYLQLVLGADTEIRKVLGINAPKKIDLLDKRRPLEQLTDEDLAQRAREADELLAADRSGS